MGPLGQFNHECYEAAVMYAQDKGYHVQLPIRGIIRGRGYEGDHFKRYLEIQIPINQKLSNSLRVFFMLILVKIYVIQKRICE